MFYQLYIKRDISKIERKNFIVSLIGPYAKLGTIDKFNNSIGFKKVHWDIVNRIFSTEIPCPENYCSPAQMLTKSIRVDMRPGAIATFEINNETINHFDKKYSYNTVDIFNKFSTFIKKVYPEIEIREVDSINDDFSDRVLNHLYLCVSEGENITAEISGNRLLTEDESNYISQELNSISDSSIKINQFFCKTCESYDKTHPYHIEVEWV